MSSKLLTEDEAAERLRIAPRTLSRWRSVRQGPVFRKMGGAVRYAESDLDDFIAHCAVSNEAAV